MGQVGHALLTRSPLSPRPKPGIPFDLHVLSTPPAFILSQNRTLHKKTMRRHPKDDSKNKEIDNPYKERTITKTPPPINPTKGPNHPTQGSQAGDGLAIKKT